ncbi:MAG: spore maturation protein [Firmicutes bacterium]|nr:spore maturation protein [Dethiobacter sp.]MBS3889350.1 spore maturation protein [Bacillota bacterium]
MILLIICAVILATGLWRGVPVFDEFVLGAKQGALIVVRLFPYVLAMILAVNLLEASGLMALLVHHVGNVVQGLGMPSEVVPLALLRPLTGSGSLAVTHGILAEHGPDSFVGLLASTIQGSNDTTLYVLTVYFGAIGVKKMRHGLVVGLLSDMASLFAAVAIVHHLFN